MCQSINDLITKLGIDPRLWQVLEARVNEELTLEEIGQRLGGVSRERVRQLEAKAQRALEKNLDWIKPILNIIETDLLEQAIVGGGQSEALIELDNQEKLTTRIFRILEMNSYQVTHDNAEDVLLIFRALVFLNDTKHATSRAEDIWPWATYLACMLTPPVMQHQKVAVEVEREYREHKSLSYRRVICQVLAEAGEPMHWSAIVERAYQLKRRSSFDSTALYNALLRYKSLFVRVGPGIYALAEWGVDKVTTYPDIITSILEQEQKALSLDLIYNRVNSARPIKRSSLVMFLDLHPRFYKSLESTYGLRTWLSPRERQTLRTPEWLVEETSSFERLERAAKRGYRIEKETIEEEPQ
jgi:hypothetical protein